MAINYRCFFCFSKAFEKLLKNNPLPESLAHQFTNEMLQLYLESQGNYSTPQLARELHNRLKRFSHIQDPYKESKKASNDLILNGYKTYQQLVNKSDDPFKTALRLAIAGNIIDFAINEEYDLDTTIQNVLDYDFALDRTNELKQALQRAKTVLYLGDNNGEIVLDKLFIETINHPSLTYATRELPVINDVTLQDAIYVGMDKTASLISNGFDAPSTILEHCSPRFLSVFNQADVIISKGQGNLEGLMETNHPKIFYLLMVKCDVIAEKLGVNKGDFVVTQIQNQNERRT